MAWKIGGAKNMNLPGVGDMYPQLVLVLGIAPALVQHLALGFFEP